MKGKGLLMDKYLLEMEHITKSFNGVKVLDDVSFNIEKGKVHALVGGNGAGKSTLMKILTGVYTKDAGTVKVEGEEVTFSLYKDACDAGIRMIFQEMSLVPTLSIAENIFLNVEKKRGVLLDKKAMVEETRLLLDKFNLSFDPNAEVASLSVGYCQLVEITKALSTNAKILVMDEPTASLSHQEVDLLFDLIGVLKEKDVSIVYISHRMDEILKVADTVSILRDGKNVATKDAGELTISSIVSYMMGNADIRDFEYRERKAVPADEEDVLRVENLYVDGIVKDVSFSVKKGEVVGIAGLMGSGRTEIMECLFGVRKKQKGEIYIEGKRAKIKDEKDSVKHGVALIPEDRRREGLVLTHSINDNIQLTVFGRTKTSGLLSKNKLNKISEHVLSALNVRANNADQVVGLLSGGNQQKIVIGKWLETFPRLMLLDEPTAGIDVGAKGEIIGIIEKFVESGNSVLIVSSEIQEMVAVCDRVLVLRDGELTLELTREQGLNEEVVQNAIQ
jgi:ribose transport system ATP-binding protein